MTTTQERIAPSIPRRGLLRFLQRVSRWSWPVGVAVAMIYTLTFSAFITRHTVVPFYDAYNYLTKSWHIAEAFHQASFWGRLNPHLYIDVSPAERPPLLLAIAGIVLGPHSQPITVAILWFGLRVGAILTGLYLISREFRNAKFVPAALMVIFGSPIMGNFTRLYVMDEPFAAFGLLAFALILIDHRRNTVLSAVGASAGILTLFLVKPVAPAFLFPMILVRGLYVIVPIIRERKRAWSLIRARIPWALPYAALFITMLFLIYGTRYGPAVREQYKLGQTGFWHVDVTARQAFTLISCVLPTWIAIALLLLSPLARRWPNKAVLVYGGAMFIWWNYFSFSTYTIEDRLIGQAMPVVVTAFLLFLCQRPMPAFIITLVALFSFSYYNFVVGGYFLPHPERASTQIISDLFPGPIWPTPPVGEIGLIPFARQLVKVVPPTGQIYIYAVEGDMCAEPNAIHLAIRAVAPADFDRVVVHWVSVMPEDFSLEYFCQRHLVITKTLRPASVNYTGTGLWAAINTYHKLVTDPQSPIHPYFHKVFESPIHEPDIQDTLVVWSLEKSPPPEAMAAALKWIEPQVPEGAWREAIERELLKLSKGATGPIQ